MKNIRISIKKIHEYIYIIRECNFVRLNENIYKPPPSADDNKIYKNKEIFKVEPQKLKQIIDECYCKYVYKKQITNLYEEISNLLGL